MSEVYGPDRAFCRIYTFKEGVLSAVGHDLKLEVTGLRVTVDGDRIEGEFDPATVRMVCVRKGRTDVPNGMSASDARQVEENARGPVLEIGRFPTIKFTVTKIDRDDPDEWMVSGQLALHGATKTVMGPAVREGAWRVARFKLNQPDFGIKPFSALLGTLRVQPRVEVEVGLMLPE